MDTVAGLPHFIRVVETGSFSKAAADGGITQPTATQPMVASEARLGAPLFHRSTRGVTLTEVGTAYHEKCQAIAHELGEGDHLAAPMPSRLQGSLRISTSVAFGRRVLTPLVLRYMRDHPGVQIDLGFDDRYVNLVEQGIDVAIRMGRLADSALGARYLGVNPWVLVGSADYLARRGVPAAPAELSAHDALIYSSVQGDERWHFGGADGRTLQVPVKGPLRSNNLSALLAAARAGLGLAALPWYVAHDAVRAGAVRPLLTEWTLPSQEMHAVFSSPRLVPAKVSSFVDFLLPCFTAEWWTRGAAAG
jgi:DNA-binding transcriptional LysR family regulator